MALTIRHITPEENRIWDQLINSSPQGSIFLLSDCLFTYVDNAPELYLLRLGCFDAQNHLVGGQMFIYKKKAMIPCQTYLYSWDYINSPIISSQILQGSQEYFDILYGLADKVKKTFYYYELTCHPSIQDVRPLLQKGWNVTPFYTHIWDLSNPGALLNELKSKKRFHQAQNLLDDLRFANEPGESIIKEFIPLYLGTAQNIGYRLNKYWERTFRAAATQMINRNVMRFLTCRAQSGELLGVTTYVLDPIRNTAYGWQLAHVPLHGGKDFIPALYLYGIKTLSNETSAIDISEGVRPSLYYFKDSLGTRSIPLFSVETPNAGIWKELRKKIKKD